MMSDGVKWIKLSTGIFDNRKVKAIEELPEGDAIINIWLKLLVLAGNVNDGGLIYLTKDIPYTDELLANEFRKPIMTVRLALDTFSRFGMIDVVNDIIRISNWEKYQNVDGMDRIREQTRQRVANYRANQKMLEAGNVTSNVTGNVTVTESNATDIDKERDKDITNSKEFVCRTGDVRHISEAWNSLGLSKISKITPTSSRGKMLRARVNEYGVEEVLNAIERIRKSSFLRGQNKQGWMITFDWFVRPNNFQKVLEGQYDDRKVNTGNGSDDDDLRRFEFV
ncbi:MAG TPA: hypothetical protein DCF66_03535 [Lachnospiraceae bacterium]|nr:hypothetical protein [Lachnospiraceae bacterium]